MRALLPALLTAHVTGLLLADRGVCGVPGALALGALGLGLGLAIRRRPARIAASLLLACAAGTSALAQRLDAAQAPLGAAASEVSVDARVARAWRSTAGPQLELASLRALDPSGSALPRRVWLSLDPDAPVGALAVGSRLRARLRIVPIAPLRNPGRPRDERRWLRRGVAARARPVHPAWAVRLGPADGAADRLASLRERLGRRLAAAGEGGALLRALAIGDASALTPATRDAFRSLGVSHLLAVSGLHLALVTGGVFALSRRALGRSARLLARADPDDAARVLALAAAVVYAALCGFGVPVQRALVLVTAVVVSTLRARRTPRLHPIVVAGLFVLVREPDAIFQGGAQLSFAACAALVWGAARRGERPGSRLGTALLGSSRAVAVTAPLAAWHWGAAAPLAVWVNLVAIPWTALVLLPAALLAAAAACLPGDGSAALVEVLARVAAWSLGAGRSLASWLPEPVGAELHGAALLLAAALGVLALRARSPLRSALIASGVGVLLQVAPPPAYAPQPPRLVAFDVGRGDAILVQGRRGSVLVDGAAAIEGHFDLGRSAVLPGLRALGVAHLDRVVATHADLDHRGGLPAVVRALPVGAVWLPPGARTDPDFAPLREAARERGVPVEEVGRGLPPLQLGDLRVRPVWPPESPGTPLASRNERSLGLRIELAGRSVLLLGDLGRAEGALLAAGGDLSADVLLLPHHGSAGSSSLALLRAVSPRIALVSAPCPPQRGLPWPDTLRRAREEGASVWWTGRDGAVFVGLGHRLVTAPFAEPRGCEAPADQRSMPSTWRS